MIPNSSSEDRQDSVDRPCFRRTDTLCMTRADLAGFSDALRAAFPAIRFVPCHYWKPFVDLKRYQADYREYERRLRLDLPRTSARIHMRDPTGKPLHYRDSLADPAVSFFYAWIEPPGWRPVWGPEDHMGVRRIENTPRLWFHLIASAFVAKRGNFWLRHDAMPDLLNARETIQLDGFDLEVRWNPSEPEAEAFGKKVFNILRRLTVSRFVAISPRDRRAFRPDVVNMPTRCLAGRHAVAWALERRHNYFKCSGGPLLKPANYPFRRRDIYTPGELRRYFADCEAEFQAKLEAYNEEMKRRAKERAKSGEPPTLDLLVRGLGALGGLDTRLPVAKVPRRKSGKSGSG